MGSQRLSGKNAVVFGGETGIGAAIVRRFSAEGAVVLATGVQAEPLRALAVATGVASMVCDVTSEAEVQAAVGRAAAMTGGLQIVVNAAGVMHADNVAEVEDRVWDRLMAINLTGTMRVCRAAVPHLVKAGGGAIVNIASVAAFNASAGSASYASGKAGVVALTRTIANEYGRYGIRANSLCPGWVRTPMSEAEMAEVAASTGVTVAAAFEALNARIALRRIASPEEMAAVALFLASDDSSFVTGIALVADGGARTPASARAV